MGAAATTIEQATGVLHAARFQGRWRSLLTSLHLSTLYEPLRATKPEITAFLDELRTSQARWLKELHLTRTQARQAYDLLHWTDRLSLILCRRELPEMGRAVEIYQDPLGHGHRAAHQVRQPAGPGTTVVVSPWPFAHKQLTVSVESQELHQLHFRDDAELAAALRHSTIETLSWTLEPK
jgi:hypothetical protein